MADPIKSQTWVTDTVLDAPALNTYNRDNWDYIRPNTVKAIGGQAYTLSNQNATSGSTSFGVTFTAAPRVFLQVEVTGSNDANVNITARTTTNFSWRLFSNGGGNQTASGTIHWIAIGTVA